MKIQLALDRLTVAEAVTMASVAAPYVDWIEVGTSLIKEFGMASISELRRAFPKYIIVADMKTFDNAVYEMEMCFSSGANVATVMAAAPKATVVACKDVADKFGGHIMVDLLATDRKKREQLHDIQDVTWCYHVSKDQQEFGGQTARAVEVYQHPIGVQVAVAGGIALDMIPSLKMKAVNVVIVGSAILKTSDPAAAAKAFYEAVH